MEIREASEVVDAVVPAPTSPGGADGAPAAEQRTRDRVVEALLAGGPLPAAQLGEQLGLGAAAVRRHLLGLAAAGLVESREQRVPGPRGRGRPPRVFALTEAGHRSATPVQAPVAYDDVAREALRFLRDTAGQDAVAAFAESRVAALEQQLGAALEGLPPEQHAEALAAALSGAGYAAAAATLPSGGAGVQLCQHHCPVQAVAAEFPELCRAETQVFERLLGTHVQRLATLAHGDGVCTTHIPTDAAPPAVPAGRTAPAAPASTLASTVSRRTSA